MTTTCEPTLFLSNHPNVTLIKIGSVRMDGGGQTYDSLKGFKQVGTVEEECPFEKLGFRGTFQLPKHA